jgi:hypothetical protein
LQRQAEVDQALEIRWAGEKRNHRRAFGTESAQKIAIVENGLKDSARIRGKAGKAVQIRGRDLAHSHWD